jgi:hypothetical protein
MRAAMLPQHGLSSGLKITSKLKALKWVDLIVLTLLGKISLPAGRFYNAYKLIVDRIDKADF